jgi:hypothetical protein
VTIDRRTALLGTLALGIGGRAAAQTRPPATPEPGHMSAPEPIETIDLWPGGAPGAPAVLPVETVKERSTDPAYNDRYAFGHRPAAPGRCSGPNQAERRGRADRARRRLFLGGGRQGRL